MDEHCWALEGWANLITSPAVESGKVVPMRDGTADNKEPVKA